MFKYYTVCVQNEMHSHGICYTHMGFVTLTWQTPGALPRKTRISQ